jgi:Tol biopolymer transport system component
MFVRYFTSRSSNISIVDLATGEVNDLTNSECAHRNPRFNTRGDSIVYTSDYYGNFDIWIMGSNGEDKRVLYRSPGNEREPRFIYNDERVIFISDFLGQWGMRDGTFLFSIDLNGENLKCLLPEKYLDKQIIYSGLRVLNDRYVYFQGKEIMKKEKTYYKVYGLDTENHTMWRVLDFNFDTMNPIISIPIKSLNISS